jgi:alkylation response protein AidB-like acyl-CoA dehydrogenase
MNMQFISYTFGKNHWQLEPDLKQVLKKYWPQISSFETDLNKFGELAGGLAYQVADYVDRTAHPILVMHDLDGNRIDRVRLNPIHHDLLKRMSFINRPPYEGGSWHHHFVYGFLLADPGLYCSLIVTNQTAYAIHKYAPNLKEYVDPLLSGSLWGATWMTETQGGSDLGSNDTIALQKDELWHLYGKNKYFASNAGLTDLALVTARPEGAPRGAKGLALFLVPRLKEDGQLNYTIRRLKDKSATRAVPTGEVELHESQAHLIGKADLGIYYTLETLTVARLANSIGAIGLARKAHLESLYRVKERSAFDSPLMEHPLIRYDLTDLTVRIAGGLALVFHAIEAFDKSWKQTPPYKGSYHYTRFLSHLAKNKSAEHASYCTQLGIEIFGGLGFMDEYPIFRLHREALVTSIWEGASNIQALDLLETVHKKGAHEPFLDEMINFLEDANTTESLMTRDAIVKEFKKLGSMNSNEAQWFAKYTLNKLADGAQVALLYAIAAEAGERFAKLAKLYASRFLIDGTYPSWALHDKDIWFPLPDN